MVYCRSPSRVGLAAVFGPLLQLWELVYKEYPDTLGCVRREEEGGKREGRGGGEEGGERRESSQMKLASLHMISSNSHVTSPTPTHTLLPPTPNYFHSTINPSCSTPSLLEALALHSQFLSSAFTSNSLASLTPSHAYLSLSPPPPPGMLLTLHLYLSHSSPLTCCSPFAGGLMIHVLEGFLRNSSTKML